MASQVRRERPIIKSVAFTPEEWATVERRMLLAGSRSFGDLARRAIVDGEIKVNQIAFDPQPIGAEMARIGNNINQIARMVNVDDGVTLEQMRATRVMVSQIQQIIEDAAKRIE